MKTSLRIKIAGIGIAALAVGGVSSAAAAHASSLSCTSKVGCGGATLDFGSNLALAVLSPDANTNGGFGYWNEPVGVNTEDYPNGTGHQDFTLFQVSGEPVAQGGQFGHGEYVAMYTPGGNLPGSNDAYCVSVQDLYRMVRGHLVQRWATVLRPCETIAGGPLQDGAPVFTGGITTLGKVSNADPYQLWGPVEVNGAFFEFQNIGLDNSSSYRHGYGGVNFVLDDTGFGGAGTQGLAYPENDGSNQKWKGIGCSAPLTSFATAYYNCPTGILVS